MKRIVLIGNNALDAKISDGGRIKTRLYADLLKQEGFSVGIIDLENWKFRFVSIVKQIIREMKIHSKIIVMAGPSGCRFVVPFVAKLNKKYKTEIVYCPLGIGTIDKLLKNKTINQISNFISCTNFYSLNDKKMGVALSEYNFVIVENEKLKKCYDEFYHLKNVVVLSNFRNINNPKKKKNLDKNLYLVYFSRVCENKGILDLIKAVKNVNTVSTNKIKLDIYGEIQLSNDRAVTDSMNEGIKYIGVVDTDKSVELLSKYDLFCLPTKYHGEGMPGSLIESLIAGVPALVSSYSQASEIIQDGVNGLIFKINDIESLEEKLRYCVDNVQIIRQMVCRVLETSKKYMYKGNRDRFLKYLG